MSLARSRSRRIRRWAFRFFISAYLVAFGVFWVEGARAYLQIASGPARLLGFAYLPILFLPVIGTGTVDGIVVRSAVWWWLFALQMGLGVAAMFVYPSERPRWRNSDRPGRALSRSGDTAIAPPPKN
jgi:hypothetical protein